MFHNIHIFVGLSSYFIGTIGILLLGWAAVRQWKRPGLAMLALFCGLVGLLCQVFIDPRFPWHGAVQRILESLMAIWMITLAIWRYRQG